MRPLESLEKNLRREIQLHPNYPDLSNMLGLLLSLCGRHEEALEQYDHALGINPKYAECISNRAHALSSLGRGVEALAMSRELTAGTQQSYDVLNTCGKIIALNATMSEARGIFEKAVSVRPHSPSAYHYIGLTLLDEDQARAASNFEKAASIGTAYIALYDSLHVYRKGKVKLSKEARNRLLEELADNPSAVKVYLNTAEMLASGGDFDAAEKEFDKARSIEPDSSSIENGLGLVGVAREYSEEAKLHFRRAIQFDPANITAHVNLAFLLGSDGSLSEAEQQMREAVELAPRYPDLRVQLATILMEREKLDEAVEHLRKALLINPRYVFAAFMLASIFLAKKRYHEVLEVYSGLDVDAIALPEIYSHLATSHLEIGSAETALEIAKKAIASDDPLPSSFVCMVLAHHKLGMTEEALACAEEYIKRFPDGPEIEEIKKLRDIMKNAAT